MFGKNPKRPPLNNLGQFLEIKNIFKTIQGEGPFVGMPAIFIRLGGCNLSCSFCDTDFEDFQLIDITGIINKAIELSLNSNDQKVIKLIVITGGEPLRQPIENLCKQLLANGFFVQIETNGTIYRDLPKEVQIVCSPKAGINGYNVLRDDLLQRLSSLKFLVAKNLEFYNNIYELGQSKYSIPVYIQPIDQYNERLNKDNTELAISLAIETGSRISVQLHKYLNID